MPIICRLRDMMAEKELKQFEVAIATKLSPTIIGNLYHNQFRRIDCKTAERLCRFFECEFGQLFELIDPPEEEETTQADREQPSSPPL
ncbi:MAG: helix-turn-helix transcriptional regulator [Oscillatoria sp. SIO1A7]|nr:helix-turn-helix transcriptional regulator [Oscillatoria sp. SIO1A7]